MNDEKSKAREEMKKRRDENVKILKQQMEEKRLRNEQLIREK